MSIHTTLCNLICVRGQMLSDTLIKTDKKYFKLVGENMYFSGEAYFQLKDMGNDTYTIVKGIRVYHNVSK